MSAPDSPTSIGIDGSPGRADEFAAAFEALAPRIYAFARRQCDVTTAQDVVADTFLVAWRRWSDVPSNALPWLLVVARNTIRNHHRGVMRRDRLADAIGRLETLSGPGFGADHDVIERDTMLRALGELTDTEREALLLVIWDGLSSADAARVADCSPRAFEVRLSRARARFARAAELPSHTAARSGPRSGRANEKAGNRRV